MFHIKKLFVAAQKREPSPVAGEVSPFIIDTIRDIHQSGMNDQSVAALWDVRAEALQNAFATPQNRLDYMELAIAVGHSLISDTRSKAFMVTPDITLERLAKDLLCLANYGEGKYEFDIIRQKRALKTAVTFIAHNGASGCQTYRDAQHRLASIRCAEKAARPQFALKNVFKLRS